MTGSNDFGYAEAYLLLLARLASFFAISQTREAAGRGGASVVNPMMFDLSLLTFQKKLRKQGSSSVETGGCSIHLFI